MRFTQISDVRGDETSSYKVDDYKSTTVREFVEEVLRGNLTKLKMQFYII